MKERGEGKEGKGKKVVHKEGVSSVRTEGYRGRGGSRPVLKGKMPKLTTLVSRQDVKVRSNFEPRKRWTRIDHSWDWNTLTDFSRWTVNPVVWWKKYVSKYPYLAQVERRYLAYSTYEWRLVCSMKSQFIRRVTTIAS